LKMTILVMIAAIIGFSNGTSCSSYRNGHTMLLYAGGPSEECAKSTVFRGLNEAEKNLIVKVHNELRQKVASGQETHGNQPGASNMMKLVWNDEIAATAQRWADQCKGGHDKVRSKCDGTGVGQNAFAEIGSKHDTRDGVYANVERGIRAWYNEVTYSGGFPSSNIKPFNYEKKYGHYTAVVWAETSEVGCGLVYFKTDELLEQQSMQSLAEPVFSYFDKDGSGYLSSKEFMKYSTKLPEKVLQALMIHLDKDGDGQLSLEEFSVLYKNAAKQHKNEKRKRFKYKTIFVCNYAAGGNSGVQMYKVGKGCSDCPNGTTCDQTYDSLCSGKCDDPMCKQ